MASTTETSTLNEPDNIMDRAEANDEKQVKFDGESTEDVSDPEKLKAGETEPVEQPLQRTITGYRFFLVMLGILSSTFLFSLGEAQPAVQLRSLGADDRYQTIPW
jgi:hypothetical protein